MPGEGVVIAIKDDVETISGIVIFTLVIVSINMGMLMITVFILIRKWIAKLRMNEFNMEQRQPIGDFRRGHDPIGRVSNRLDVLTDNMQARLGVLETKVDEMQIVEPSVKKAR